MRKIFATVLTALGIGGAAATQAQTTPPAEMSGDLRAMVFRLSAKDIGITQDTYHQQVWGVVMETGLDRGYYTLVALADGSTSLYFSTGGGIIGAGEHPGVRDASTAFIQAAEDDLAQAHPSSGHAPPKKGETAFYFLTFNGTETYHASEKDLGERKDKLSNLFYAAQATITAIRKVQSQ